jgi:hypothetical protein
MKTIPLSETDALRASTALTPMPAGLREAEIREVIDGHAKSGKEMLTTVLGVIDDEGVEREVRDYLTSAPAAAARLRHLCAAVPGALAKYEAGSIVGGDLVGHRCMVKLGVEKRKNYAPRNSVEDYLPAETAAVVPLRAAG